MQRVAAVWMAGMIFSSCLTASEAPESTNRVYRLSETMPVKGTLVIRAIRSIPDGQIKPVEFSREKRGWLIVAESFEAYREAMAEKERELAEARAAQAKTNALRALEALPSRPLNQQIGFVAQRLAPDQRALLQADLARQAKDPRLARICPPST